MRIKPFCFVGALAGFLTILDPAFLHAQAATPTPTECLWTQAACTGPYPSGAQAGDILLTIRGAGIIAGFHPQTGVYYVFKRLTTGDDLDGIIVDPYNPCQFLVADESSNSILRFDGMGNQLADYVDGLLHAPKIPGFDPLNGDLYIPDAYTGNLQVVRGYVPPGSTGTAITLGPPGIPVGLPICMTFDHAGNLYMSSAASGNIVKFTAAELAAHPANPIGTVFAHVPSDADGLLYDGQSHFYMGGRNPAHLYKIAMDGSWTVLAQSPAIADVDGLVMDLAGNLWITQLPPLATGISLNGLSKIDLATGHVLAYYPLPSSFGGIVDDPAILGMPLPRQDCTTATLTPTITLTPIPSATWTATPSATSTATSTKTSTRTSTTTPIPTSTSLPCGFPGNTCTPTVTGTPTSTSTSTPDPGLNCTLTQGYWKTHNKYAVKASLLQPWPLSEDTLLCGMTWYNILQTDPTGNAWYILAHQWIAASLNIAKGASAPLSVQNALIQAASLLTGNCSSIPPGWTTAATDLSGLLDSYNNGVIGPGHCSGSDGSNSLLIYPNPADGRYEVHVQLPAYPGAVDVDLQVYTTAFRKIQEVKYPQVPGYAALPLGLSDLRGTPLANGLYYVLVRTSLGSWTGKLLVLR